MRAPWNRVSLLHSYDCYHKNGTGIKSHEHLMGQIDLIKEWGLPSYNGGMMVIKKTDKVLCMCRGGNCRSVYLAYVFKYYFGIDALSVGFERNSFETISMLCKWADRIVVVDPEAKKYIPIGMLKKVEVFDVGPDRWWNPPEDLCKRYFTWITERVKGIMEERETNL